MAGGADLTNPTQSLTPHCRSNSPSPPGTWINLRVDQELSSDHNRPGDVWTATLTQPIIVNGRVVAQRGQTVGGVVAEAEKAGRAKGTSRLALDMNELMLADGRQIPIRSRLMEFRGTTSKGRDAAAVGTTVATGAAIGAAVNGGVGAGVGAAAGVVASTVGVLLTRGGPTVIYPETTLTFRLEAPFTFAIDNEASLRAFAPVQAEDYRQPALRSRTTQPGPSAPGYYTPVSLLLLAVLLFALLLRARRGPVLRIWLGLWRRMGRWRMGTSRRSPLKQRGDTQLTFGR